MASLCHLGDLIDALYNRAKVQPLVPTHYRDARVGIRCGAAEEILCRFLASH